jgi:hypothetical protein
MREIEFIISEDEAASLDFYLQRAREHSDTRGQVEIDRLRDMLAQVRDP